MKHLLSLKFVSKIHYYVTAAGLTLRFNQDKVNNWVQMFAVLTHLFYLYHWGVIVVNKRRHCGDLKMYREACADWAVIKREAWPVTEGCFSGVTSCRKHNSDMLQIHLFFFWSQNVATFFKKLGAVIVLLALILQFFQMLNDNNLSCILLLAIYDTK